MIYELIKIKKKCTHSKLPLLTTQGYCPDCGELIQTHWIICRCKCCGIKRKAIIKFGKVLPEDKFCQNCGSPEFATEDLDKLDFSNIQYAVIQRVPLNSAKFNLETIQTWFCISKPNCFNQILISVQN